jgi:hypothetical protein
VAKAKTLVGLDVHATKIVAAVLDAETGELQWFRVSGDIGEAAGFAVELICRTLGVSSGDELGVPLPITARARDRPGDDQAEYVDCDFAARQDRPGAVRSARPAASVSTAGSADRAEPQTALR